MEDPRVPSVAALSGARRPLPDLTVERTSRSGVRTAGLLRQARETMTIAALKTTRLSDEEVVAWRVEQLLRAGADSFCAVILARRSQVDLHEAVDLLERGCPSKIALEILL